jgi:hypothetical protein
MSLAAPQGDLGIKNAHDDGTAVRVAYDAHRGARRKAQRGQAPDKAVPTTQRNDATLMAIWQAG